MVNAINCNYGGITVIVKTITHNKRSIALYDGIFPGLHYYFSSY